MQFFGSIVLGVLGAACAMLGFEALCESIWGDGRAVGGAAMIAVGVFMFVFGWWVFVQ